MLWFFMFFIWIWLLIIVFSDIFRSHDIGGFAKALWVMFVIVVPYLGVFVYLIARGHKMAEHAQEAAQAQHAAFKQAVQQAAGTGTGDSAADQLAKLADAEGQRHDRRRRVPAAQGAGRRVTRSRRSSTTNL